MKPKARKESESRLMLRRSQIRKRCGWSLTNRKMTSSSRDRIPFRVKPMLASLVAEPFHRDGWVYEEKYDGDRMLAYKEGDHVQLLSSRNAIDRTSRFPKIAAAILALRPVTLLLDGEMVALDKRWSIPISAFAKWKGRTGLRSVRLPLRKRKRSSTAAALEARRAILEKAIGSYADWSRPGDYIRTDSKPTVRPKAKDMKAWWPKIFRPATT